MTAAGPDRCRRGHIADEGNTFTAKSGYRGCRECARESSRRRHHRYAIYSPDTGGAKAKPVRVLTAEEAALVESSLGLARWVASRFRVQTRVAFSEMDDMIQDGMVGLALAAQNYSPTFGFAFSTFAVPRIRSAIRDGMEARLGAGRWFFIQQLEMERADSDMGPEDAVVGGDLISFVDRWRETSPDLDDVDRRMMDGMLLGLRDRRLAAHAGVSKATAHRRKAALRALLSEAVAA